MQRLCADSDSYGDEEEGMNLFVGEELSQDEPIGGDIVLPNVGDLVDVCIKLIL